MSRFLAFGVSAAVSAAFFPALPAGAEAVKPAPGVAKPLPSADKPFPGNASRGSSIAAPEGTPDDAAARRLREEDERKATESKEKMKKRPGYKEDVPGPRA